MTLILLLKRLRHFICLMKSPPAETFPLNLMAISARMTGKRTNNSAQKSSNFSSKANYAKSLFFLCSIFSFSLCADFPEKADELKIPLGLPPIPWPKDNPYSSKKAELGKLLYFDKRLSSNGTISCASCHAINETFADHKAVSDGIYGNKGTRNSQTVINSAYHKHLFWDGRALSLEEQVKGPLSNPKEMTAASSAHQAYIECQNKIRENPGYKVLFKEVFGTDECSVDEIAKAIATFERTVLSGNSPYDRYAAGDRSAMSSEAIQGLKIFNRVGCANCHAGFNFADGRFLNIGVGMNAEKPDLGRYDVTKEEKDRGSFRVPILREIANTYPYMHDGSLKTLEEVIDYYDKGGISNPQLSPLMRPLKLTSEEKYELKLFLESLSGEGWQHFKEPSQFPE